MTDATATAMACPKDANAMQPMGRRSGAWRCPTCRGVFIDTQAMRQRRAGRPPVWAPVVMSVLATLVVRRMLRRLTHRRAKPTPAKG
jgi:hypothetical protein